jgi:pimeloyl-ACP methyl ester carboxylesterase
MHTEGGRSPRGLGTEEAEEPASERAATPGSLGPYTIRPTGHAEASDGLSVAYYQLGGVGPDLLLAHATGFCGAVLAPLAAALSDRLRCVALDLRAHGQSGRPTGELDWHGFSRDVLAVVDRLELQAPVGFGHSCGGASLLLAEEARPGTFSALYCFEPVVYPGEVPLAPSANPLSSGALRRRTSFASRHEALDNFSAKSPFDRLRPDVLAEYVDNGFASSPGGGIRLRCRREDEADIYAHSFSHDAFAQMGLVRCPVVLACGEHTDAFGPDFLTLFADRLPRSTTAVLPGLGHFGPLEDPDAVARSLVNELAGFGF